VAGTCTKQHHQIFLTTTKLRCVAFANQKLQNQIFYVRILTQACSQDLICQGSGTLGREPHIGTKMGTGGRPQWLRYHGARGRALYFGHGAQEHVKAHKRNCGAICALHAFSESSLGALGWHCSSTLGQSRGVGLRPTLIAPWSEVTRRSPTYKAQIVSTDKIKCCIVLLHFHVHKRKIHIRTFLGSLTLNLPKPLCLYGSIVGLIRTCSANINYFLFSFSWT
jgi:hypothetical protein